MEQGKLVKEIVKALGMSILVTVLFLLLMAFVMLKSGLSEGIVSKIMIAGYLLAPAAGGFMLGKKRKVNRFLWGLLIGVVYYFIYFAIAVCTQNVPVTDLLWVTVPVCFGGMAGGMLS